MRAVVDARNAFKHHREPNASELASTEAGLLWLEACLNRIRQAEEETEEDEVGEELALAVD